MKTVPSLFPLALAAVLLAAGTASAAELRATVRNVKPEQGRVMIALYGSQEAMATETRAAAQALPATGPEVTAVFRELPQGRYVIAVYQDLDGDGQLGRPPIGRPTEPWGFGGDPDSAYGPPRFDDAAVSVTGAPVAVTATLTD